VRLSGACPPPTQVKLPHVGAVASHPLPPWPGSLREYQLAEAGAARAAETVDSARLAGKAGLNTTTRVAATATQTIHGVTLGKVRYLPASSRPQGDRGCCLF